MCRRFFYAVVVSLNPYILFTESFLVDTLTNKLLYEFMILPDFCQFDVKNEPAGFRSDRTGQILKPAGSDRMGKIRPVPTLPRKMTAVGTDMKMWCFCWARLIIERTGPNKEVF